MLKKKKIFVYSDLKTGFFYKLFLIIGLILLIFYLIENAIHFIGINEGILSTLLAFAILAFGLGFIFYFLSSQFAKLAEIAKEIENENINEDVENTK